MDTQFNLAADSDSGITAHKQIGTRCPYARLIIKDIDPTTSS